MHLFCTSYVQYCSFSSGRGSILAPVGLPVTEESACLQRRRPEPRRGPVTSAVRIQSRKNQPAIAYSLSADLAPTRSMGIQYFTTVVCYAFSLRQLVY